MHRTLSTLCLLASFSLFTSCGDPGGESTQADPATPPHPTIAAVLTDTAPEGAISVLEARKQAKPGDTLVIEGIIAGTLAPFTEGYASLVLGDTTMETCNKNPDDACPTPWDACCADPETLKGMRLTLQIPDAGGRPVAQGLKGVVGMKELDALVVAGTVTAESTPENLVVNVTQLHQKVQP